MNRIQKFIIVFFSALIIASYVLGFYYNENSIGSGGYSGDFAWMWENFEIFKNENLLQAVKSNDFFGNRTALLYILNIYLNPFINDIDSYRLSITAFSLFASYILFLCIREKYENIDTEIIGLLSLIILLSPFFRTSSFWGMETQYGIISSLVSILFFLKDKKLNNGSYYNIFLSIFFSSVTVYFDLKLVIIPIFIYLNILFSNLNNKLKFFSTISYLILALPYFFLILLWDGIVPVATQQANPLQVTHLIGAKFHMVNFLFATNILGFYLFPFLILKKDIFNFNSVKNLSNILNFSILLLFIIYLFYFINADLYDYVDMISREKGGYKDFWGLGYSAKLSNILFENRFFSILLNLIIYIISVLIIILFINSNYINFFLVLFFLILSITLFPLMQEYFDPYIYIISILLVKNKYYFSFKRCGLIFFYYSSILTSSIIFYS